MYANVMKCVCVCLLENDYSNNTNNKKNKKNDMIIIIKSIIILRHIYIYI